jgi:hypothetical protein
MKPNQSPRDTNQTAKRRSLNRLVSAAELEMYEGIAEIHKLVSELESLQHRMARAADALRMKKSLTEATSKLETKQQGKRK